MEMALCREYQIPHSHFMGGPQRWTTLDREKGLAYEMLLREQCPDCGTLEEDWKDERGYPLEEPFLTPIATRCPGCAEVARLRKEIPSEVVGAHVHLVPLASLNDDEDVDHYDPRNDPEEQKRLLEDKLAEARSLGE